MAVGPLLDLRNARGYSLAVRLERDGRGFLLSINAGRHDGAFPRWERRFPTATRYEDAADLVASSLVTYFTATSLAGGKRSVEPRDLADR